jgi:exopolysaccharide biosynthesis operon protein EpsL
MLRSMQKKIDLAVAAALACLAATAVPALAQISDTIHPYAEASINHDDNLLRLSDNVGGDQSDTYRTVAAGLQLQRPFGRQILTADARISRVTFNRFEELNYNGKDVSASLEWHIANHLQGHIGGNFDETLAPFADSHTEQRNVRQQKRYFVDGNWLFHPSWQVHGSWSRDRNTYELLQQRYNNRTEDTSEVGFDYLASTNSRLGLLARHLKGTYTDRAPLSFVQLDTGYVQDEIKANIYWYFSAVSQLQVMAGSARRKSELFPVRDDSGANGRLTYFWVPRAKLHFTGKAWREFMAVDGTFLNSALSKGVSVDSTYDVTGKIGATAGARAERRKFSALPGTITAGGLDDSSRKYTVGVTYAPLPRVSLGLSAFRESRDGSVAAGTNTYKANGVSFNVSAQF